MCGPLSARAALHNIPHTVCHSQTQGGVCGERGARGGSRLARSRDREAEGPEAPRSSPMELREREPERGDRRGRREIEGGARSGSPWRAPAARAGPPRAAGRGATAVRGPRAAGESARPARRYFIFPTSITNSTSILLRSGHAHQNLPRLILRPPSGSSPGGDELHEGRGGVSCMTR